MKKIEFFVSDDFFKVVDGLCENKNYTKAEFGRRAFEAYVEKLQDKKKDASDE